MYGRRLVHSRRMAHGDPRPARTPSSRDQRSYFFRIILRGSLQHVTYVTDFCRVGRVVHPSWGATPRDFRFSGAGVVAALATCHITREDGAIIDICKVMFCRDCGSRVRVLVWKSYRTSRSFGYGYESVTELPEVPGIVARAYRTHRSSGRARKVRYPYPGYCGTGCTELTEVPGTGMNVLPN